VTHFDLFHTGQTKADEQQPLSKRLLLMQIGIAWPKKIES